MKKQLFIFVVALMAFGINKAFAQPPNLSAPAPTLPPTEITAACVATAGPLNPIAGTEYTYTVNVPTPIGGKTFHWFVTTDPNLITGAGNLTTVRDIGDGTGTHIAASGTNYNVPTDGTEGPNSVDITWKAFTHDPTQPVLLVIYVEDEDCTNDNLEAYLIRPVHAFTLDIANLSNVTGAEPAVTVVGEDHPICVSPVESAVYAILDAATGEGEIQFDYGVNYMFFIVTAANFTDSWMPRFQIDGGGLSGSRVISAIDWAYPADAAAGTWVTDMTGGSDPGSVWTGGTAVEAQDPLGSVGADGESIIVRMTIENNQQETIIAAPISLAVDGTMFDAGATAGAEYDNAGLADIHYAEGPGTPAECPWFDEFENDVVTQVLTPRPDINEGDPVNVPFVPTDKE